VATETEQKSPETIFQGHNNFIEKKFTKARVWTENKYFDFPGQAWLFNRQNFDEYLFGKAKEAGVEIRFGRKAAKIKEKKTFVEVMTKDGKIFQGKILAGCDGVLSTVAREAGLPRQKNLLLGVIFYLPNDQLSVANCQNFYPERSRRVPELFFSKDFPGFFAWRIPRGNCIEYGTALEPKEKPKERLEKWLKKNFQFSIFNFQNVQFKGALVPFYPLKKTATKRVFLCGDAAGQIKPMTGGGLVYGLCCAKIAVKKIDPDNPDLEIYEKEWRKALMKEIRFGNILRKSYRLPLFLKKASLSFFQKRKNLDQDNPLTILKF
jgi:flavin-dependent dehydrogenase